jgi:hypothetical protein
MWQRGPPSVTMTITTSPHHHAQGASCITYIVASKALVRWYKLNAQCKRYVTGIQYVPVQVTT